MDELEVLTDAAENERRMKFSFAVAEMIAMAPHAKQLLVQVTLIALHLGAFCALHVLR